MSGTDGQQWIRKAGLYVLPQGDQPGLDLSELRFVFQVRAQDTTTPNTAVIRVYNMSDKTAERVRKEFTRVVVQAGYVNTSYGVIFDGTICQTRMGRERNVDSYVDILAADGDAPYNMAIINTTLAPGATNQQQLAAIDKSIQPFGSGLATQNGLPGGVLPRGKVLFGGPLLELDNITRTAGYTWTFQNGKVVPIPLTGYLPNEVVVLSSQTGLIGVPEVTQQGVQVVCLINPKIRIGTRIQINNDLINRVNDRGPGILPSYANPFAGAYAMTTADGIYRVLVQEFEGDSRGNPWYARLTCLAVDPSAKPAASVQRYP